MRNYWKLVVLLSTTLMGSQAFSQESQAPARKIETANQGWKGSVSANYLTIDSDAGASAGIGDDTFGLDLAGNYYFTSQLMATFSVGFIVFDDEAEFQEQVIVTDIFGSDVETLDSSAGAIPIVAELKYQGRIPVTTQAWFRVGAGYSHLAVAQREISNCTDCREEDLEIDGGGFATASVFRDLSSGYKIGLSGKQYFSGDLSSGISLWMEFSR